MKTIGVDIERLKIAYEELRVGKVLPYFQSEKFWQKERLKAGNRWWKLWWNKNDLQIIFKRNKGHD